MTRNEWIMSFIEEIRPYFEMMRVKMPKDIRINVGEMTYSMMQNGQWVINISKDHLVGITVADIVVNSLVVSTLYHLWFVTVRYFIMGKRLGHPHRGAVSVVLDAMIEAAVAKLGPYPEV